MTTPDAPAPAIPVPAGQEVVARLPLLRTHAGTPPDLVLRWNEMASAPATVDVVVHLHGFSARGRQMSIVRDKLPKSGLDLAPPGEGVAAWSGRSRPTLCVLPRGSFDDGPRHNAYSHPVLHRKDGLRELVEVALERFATRVGAGAPGVGRLILTAHSGGGEALEAILGHSRNDPDEVHVFDALYWPPVNLARWTERHVAHDLAAFGHAASAGDIRDRGGALRVFYVSVRGGTAPLSEPFGRRVAGALGPGARGLSAFYRVQHTLVDHSAIPRRFGGRLLADACADVADS